MASAPWPVTFALFIAGALVPTLAHADEVGGTRSELLVETGHVVDVSVAAGFAELVVRRTVRNGGERHDQAVFWIDVPAGGVAAGLRTLGTLHGKPKWFAGELMEAEAAAERYRELTGIGGYYPKDPALLSWRSQENLALQVFPVAPAGDKTIEYTLWLPTYYEGGHHHVDLPAIGTDDLSAELVVRPAHVLDQILVDGVPVGRGSRFSAADEHTISLARYAPPRLDGGLASLDLGDDRSLVHWEVAAAAQLSKVPDDADVVVLIDGSRSMNGSEEAMRDVARSVLGHFVGHGKARAEVIVFDRVPRPRHGRLVPVRDAITELEHLRVGDANGSHLDAALDAAAGLLAARPRRPKRVIVLTDGRVRTSLPDARLGTHLRGAGGLAHVGIARGGGPGLVRDDAHPWSTAARATGGLVWALQADADTDAEELSETFEELARPVRIHALELVASPLADPGASVPGELPEGEGLFATWIAEGGVRHVHVQGELWATPIRHAIRPSREVERRWSGLVFGDPLLHELTEEQMMPLALRAGVVSPVTSYLAIEPGVRPSTEGLDELEGSGFGSGSGSGSGVGFGSRGRRVASVVDRDAVLTAALRKALDACGGAGRSATLELETTSFEIVDVGAPTITGDPDPVLETCTADQMWAVLLPSAFDEPRKTWHVKA